MFRRRTCHAKRLLNARLGAQCHDRANEAQVKKLVKAMTDKEVEMLAGAVASGGGGGCLLVEEPTLAEAPRVIACRAWRWPELSGDEEMKRMPCCPAEHCCNPFHWSRLCRPEWPPPPYCRHPSERLKPEDGACSEDSQLELRGSLSTNGEGDSGNRRSGWCLLAYWELAYRVGRMFSVESPAVDVFWNLANGDDGLCLSSLASYHPPRSVQVKKAREKIGRGLTLSKEKDGVWAYNLSENPLFINSPCLEDDSGRCHVARVPPGYCLNIFNGGGGGGGGRSQRPRRAARRLGPPTGPVDPNSVRISFAKGWGPQYTRQDVTNCPVWLEILLAPCR